MKTMVMMAMEENTAEQQQQQQELEEDESIAPLRQREDEESNSSIFPHVVAASRTGNVVTSWTGNVVTSWTGNVVTSSGTGNVVTSWTGNVVAHTKLVMMMGHGESMMTNQFGGAQGFHGVLQLKACLACQRMISHTPCFGWILRVSRGHVLHWTASLLRRDEDEVLNARGPPLFGFNVRMLFSVALNRNSRRSSSYCNRTVRRL
jgi:hypothetical protein